MMWQYYFLGMVGCMLMAGLAGYYLDRDELICIELIGE